MNGVLAIYDLRGIQSFIFRTNKTREVIGGSEVVRTLLEDALAAFVKTRKDETHLLEWMDGETPLPFRFMENESICSEVLYCGGGNLLVAWRTAQQAREAGRFMHEFILRHAYSLGLSYATTPIGENYQHDYVRLCANLDVVKSMGGGIAPVPCCPFSVLEQDTGLPAVWRGGSDRISEETALKRNAAASIYNKHGDGGRYILQFDKMTTDSKKAFLAVVHVDGNSMGARIRERLESCLDYGSAVRQMRALSYRISTSFTEALDEAFDCQAQRLKLEKGLPMRSIVCAGDDITFVCRADLAIDITRDLIARIERQSMCDDAEGHPDPRYAFSACAGIAFVHNHYPFFKAYTLAEELCAEAKSKAKDPKNMREGKVGSYIDLHILSGALAGELKQIREREYVNAEGWSLLQRPLCCGEEEREDSVHMLLEHISRFASLPRTWLKRARNAYCISENEVRTVFREAGVYAGRGIDGQEQPFDTERHAIYFDALELMDMLGELSEQETDEQETNAQEEAEREVNL